MREDDDQRCAEHRHQRINARERRAAFEIHDGVADQQHAQRRSRLIEKAGAVRVARSPDTVESDKRTGQ